MAIEDVTEAELLDEIAEALRLPDKPPGSFTAQDMADRWGCTARSARQRLEKLVEQGKVERIKIEFSVYYRMVQDG